jgi:hypothetical protein
MLKMLLKMERAGDGERWSPCLSAPPIRVYRRGTRIVSGFVAEKVNEMRVSPNDP